MNKNLQNSIIKLDNWIENNGWSGYDPYDIKSLPWVLKLSRRGNKNKYFEICREITFEYFYAFPVLTRKLFGVTPQLNSKGMGLFSKAYLDLYKKTGKQEYLVKSDYCLTWLTENKSYTGSGMGWGYPFDWQSDMIIPKSTPNGIVTTTVGDAYWAWYKYTGKKEYIDSCVQICLFLVSLPVDHISQSLLCFSYTPLFKNHIHNLNIFIAEFLIKIGMETKNQEWVDLGTMATNYSLSAQMSNGAFDYNGPPETPKNYVDNYHTGFMLRMLHSIWKLTKRNDIYDALERCFIHYTQNLFEDSTIPKLLPERKYRIDIHSCAESINCLSQLSEDFPDGLKIAKNVAEWTINNLQDDEGYFYYGKLKSRFTGRIYTSRIPYIRWGQAWMLKSLSNLLSKL
jgi:rhamnogalacturonyl hydrolase YesR